MIQEMQPVQLTGDSLSQWLAHSHLRTQIVKNRSDGSNSGEHPHSMDQVVKSEA